MSKKSSESIWSHGAAAFPGMSSLNDALVGNPFAASFSGGMDFVKSLWGGMPSSVPGFVVPTLDVEELDKRIKDLKAVDNWLTMNGNMLRATIQALEVQRNTIATLQSLGGTLAESANNLSSRGRDTMSVATPEKAGTPPDWPRPRHAAPDPAPASAAQATATAAPDDAPSASKDQHAGSDAASQAAKSAGAWLGFLQDQFSKVASAALAGSQSLSASSAKADEPLPRKRKPAASKSAASKSAASKSAASKSATSKSRASKSAAPKAATVKPAVKKPAGTAR